jgi:hypothetical protein
MPITEERLHNLLIEHEAALTLAHNVAQTITESVIEDHYNFASDADKLATIKDMLRTIADKLPDKWAVIERRSYNANNKRNRRMKEKMRLRRRRAGVPERIMPGSPAQVEREHAKFLVKQQEDLEYERFLRGETAQPVLAPRYAEDGTPIWDEPTTDVPSANDGPAMPEKLMTPNEKFLASLPPPEAPKSDEQLAAESVAMLDSIEDNGEPECP